MFNKIKKFFVSYMLSALCVFMQAQAFCTQVTLGGMGSNTQELSESIGKIVSVLFWVACVVCTIKIIHIGILYILSGAEGKSKAKGALLPWIIGVAICATFATLGPAIMDLFYEGKPVLSY